MSPDIPFAHAAQGVLNDQINSSSNLNESNYAIESVPILPARFYPQVTGENKIVDVRPQEGKGFPMIVTQMNTENTGPNAAFF